MKKVLVATVIAISLSSGSVAFAETPASPRPKAQANGEFKAALDKWKSDNQAAINAYKAALADYMAKLKANAEARKNANDAFKKAVDAARNAYKAAMTAATTAEAKTAAENARKAALEAGRAFSQAFADTGDGLTPERAQELEKGLQKITDGYKKIADQQVNNLKASREWDTGWKEAFANYTENAQNAAEQARTYFETFTKGFEDALVKFVETGKLSFKDLANSIIADFIRIQVRQQLSSQTGLLAGLFSFGKSLFGLAAGGPTNANQPYIVGEQGPELFVPRTAGTIVPNNQLSSAAPMVTNVSYSISAVDASSFRQLVAQDPQFIYNITEVGRRSVPSRRLA